MAEKFNFPSVHQFVVEILRSSSAQRLAWLQQYYTSLNHPDLATTVTKNFPQSDSEQTTSAATTSRSTKTAATKSHTQAGAPPKDVPKATKKHKHTQKNLELRTKPEIPQSTVSVPQKKSTRVLQSNVSVTQMNYENPQNDVLEPEEKQKIIQRTILEPVTSVPSPESEEQETICRARGHRRTKRDSVSSSGAGCRAGGGLGVDDANSSGLGSGKAAAFSNRTDRDIPSSPDLSHDRSTMLSKPTAQGGGRGQKSSSGTRNAFQGQSEQSSSALSNHSYLTDLIGDTSILDDLLKPKPRGAQQRSTPKTPAAFPVAASAGLDTPPSSRIVPQTSTGLFDSLSSPSSHTPSTHQVSAPVQTAKQSRKDFWDILNEGSEESINRLTDMAEVQRVCVNTDFSAKRRSREVEESKSLWKTNEKFLWKK